MQSNASLSERGTSGESSYGGRQGTQVAPSRHLPSSRVIGTHQARVGRKWDASGQRSVAGGHVRPGGVEHHGYVEQGVQPDPVAADPAVAQVDTRGTAHA